MPNFISIILQGVKQWVEDKLNKMSFVIANHIVQIRETLADIAFEESTYDENALFTESQDNVKASGLVSKVGKKVTMFINQASTVSGFTDVSYRLPYEPDSAYTAIINSRGILECNDTSYKISLQNVVVSAVTYPSLTLNRYDNGTISNWDGEENLSFEISYVTSE